MLASAADAAALTVEAGRLILGQALEKAGGGGVILAVSGGPDSVAMMHFAARACRAMPALPGICVATVDHGLRDASRQEVEAVLAMASELGLPSEALAWTGPKPRSRIQEAAREARYALLLDCARRRKATAIFTAHTRDDQAETVLQRLVHGSGLRGLGGIRPVSRRGDVGLVRPLLDIDKASLLGLCRSEGWPYFSDPANQDTRYGRVRVRQIMQALAGEGLSAARLATVAARLQRAEAALAGVAAERFAVLFTGDGGVLRLDGAGFMTQPAEIRWRLLAEAIRRLAAASDEPQGDEPLRLERCETAADRVSAALSAGQRLRVSLGGAVVTVAGGQITIVKESQRQRGRIRDKGSAGAQLGMAPPAS